ncbi:MFS transporter [Paenarthrobacter ureafaciens]|uniref:MFS transporter n=1 Tax=Paenarthrobacter ureafaciens TaxID=37931 RepID=UPI002DB74511|nr:MFS transporter [Paenarthrobacter ureafaciens]MEC3851882.1 MFS transporter [Paenarthrobacter ureafaciens]
MTIVEQNTAQPGTGAERLRLQRKSLLATGVGNLLEWFDWTIYTVASVYIAGSLFNSGNPMSALLSTLAVFAVGFLMRPIGGLVFGPLADKLGRRKVLLTTMFLMAGASLGIALIPSYAVIGSWASLLLLLARLVQGFAHGGESTTSYAYIAEIAPPKRRGLWSSSVFIAVGSGSLLATFFMALLTGVFSKTEMMEWGWRIPFAAGALLAVAALWLRRGMMESEHVAAAPESSAAPAWSRKQVVTAGVRLFLYEAGATLTYYTWVTSAAIYAIGVKGMDPGQAFVMSAIAQVVYILFLPVSGWISDHWGRKTTTLISLVGIAATVFPLWALMSSEPWTLLVAQTVGLLLVAFITGSKPAAISEQIPTRYRTRIFGVSISLGVAICGGTASYLSTWLNSIGNGWIFNIYVIAVAAISTLVVLKWKNNSGVPLHQVR